MKQIFTTSLFLFLLFNAYTQDNLELASTIDTSVFMMDTFQHTYPLKDYVQVLKDPTGKYEITDFLNGRNSEFFKPLTEFSHKDFNQAPQPPWIKVSIQNNIERIFWSFELWTGADSILAYIINEDQSIDSFKRGRLVSYAETRTGVEILNDTYDGKKPIYTTINKGERKEVFYKVYPLTRHKNSIYPSLTSMEALYKSQQRMHFPYMRATFHLGLIWMLLFYNLFIYLFYRNKGYLYLALYISCFSIPADFRTKLLLAKEWSIDYLFLHEFYWLVFAPALFIFLTLFMREYLNAKKLYPKVDLIFKIMIGISFVYFAIMLGDYMIYKEILHRKAIIYTTIQTIVQMSLFIVVSIRLFKYKKPEIRFLILSIAVLLFFNLLDRLPEIFGWTNIEQTISGLLYPITTSSIGRFTSNHDLDNGFRSKIKRSSTRQRTPRRKRRFQISVLCEHFSRV